MPANKKMESLEERLARFDKEHSKEEPHLFLLMFWQLYKKKVRMSSKLSIPLAKVSNLRKDKDAKIHSSHKYFLVYGVFIDYREGKICHSIFLKPITLGRGKPPLLAAERSSVFSSPPLK